MRNNDAEIRKKFIKVLLDAFNESAVKNIMPNLTFHFTFDKKEFTCEPNGYNVYTIYRNFNNKEFYFCNNIIIQEQLVFMLPSPDALFEVNTMYINHHATNKTYYDLTITHFYLDEVDFDKYTHIYNNIDVTYNINKLKKKLIKNVDVYKSPLLEAKYRSFPIILFDSNYYVFLNKHTIVIYAPSYSAGIAHFAISI